MGAGDQEKENAKSERPSVGAFCLTAWITEDFGRSDPVGSAWSFALRRCSVTGTLRSAHEPVSADAKVTHCAEVKQTHRGNNDGFARAVDVEPGASSGDTSIGPSGVWSARDSAAVGLFAEYGRGLPSEGRDPEKIDAIWLYGEGVAGGEPLDPSPTRGAACPLRLTQTTRRRPELFSHLQRIFQALAQGLWSVGLHD